VTHDSRYGFNLVSFFLAQRPLPSPFWELPRCHSIWRNARRYEQSKQLLLLAYLINKSKHMQIVADLEVDAVRKIRGRFVFEKNVRTILIWQPCRGAEMILGMLSGGVERWGVLDHRLPSVIPSGWWYFRAKTLLFGS
jgi:hypothetical protein